jgi:hypothetical protein
VTDASGNVNGMIDRIEHSMQRLGELSDANLSQFGELTAGLST